MKTSTRSLGLQGATNFRDLGGYRTAHGRSVRRGRLFRSNHLAGLTDADLAAVGRLGLQTVVDFRHENEVAAAQNRPLPGARALGLPIDPSIRQTLEAAMAAGQVVDEALAQDLMRAFYRGLVLDYADHFAKLFRLLLEDGAPLVFHCSAGKDRTGFAAALVLHVLGVPREAIVQDYLLTPHFWQIDPASVANLPEGVGAVLGGVQEDFLEAAFAAIDTERGGIDLYLERQLGVGSEQRERLRALYLED
ncbi:MAG TPA: tyrosine-protein phosphatase [Ramlibacter sp.]|nr:tyrosine-protein phosphatase [Ramlibacter sp.]